MQSARMGRAPLHMPVPGLGVKAFLDLRKRKRDRRFLMSSVILTYYYNLHGLIIVEFGIKLKIMK